MDERGFKLAALARRYLTLYGRVFATSGDPEVYSKSAILGHLHLLGSYNHGRFTRVHLNWGQRETALVEDTERPGDNWFHPGSGPLVLDVLTRAMPFDALAAEA